MAAAELGSGLPVAARLRAASSSGDRAGANTPDRVDADSNLDSDPVGSLGDLGRDDPGLRVETAQSGGIVMPACDGADAEQAA